MAVNHQAAAMRSVSERPRVQGNGRRLLLGAARRLFGENGYNGTSTQAIAAAAGVTEPMVFRHFGTKARLFQEAAVAPFVDYIESYLDEYRAREHGRLSPEDEGRVFLEGLFTALHEQRDILVALLAARQSGDIDEAGYDEVRAAFARVLAHFEEVVGTEAAERGFDQDNLAASVKVMFSMVLSLALHDDWLLSDGRTTHRELLEAMTMMSVRGLGVPSRTDTRPGTHRSP